MRGIAALGLGCSGLASPQAVPVPPEHQNLIGSWSSSSSTTTLTITPEGHVDFLRRGAGWKVSIRGPVTQWSDDAFVVQVGGSLSERFERAVLRSEVRRSTLRIDSPAHQVGAEWAVTIDGVALEGRSLSQLLRRSQDEVEVPPADR